MRLARTFAWVLCVVLAVGIGGWLLVRRGQPAIIGTWKRAPFSDGATEVLTILSDGTIGFDGNGAKYRIVDGDNLVVTFEKENVNVMPFTVEGDRLHLRIGTSEVEYIRDNGKHDEPAGSRS